MESYNKKGTKDLKAGKWKHKNIFSGLMKKKNKQQQFKTTANHFRP